MSAAETEARETWLQGVNAVAAVSMGDPNQPLGKLIKVLNNQLQALTHLDARTDQLAAKVDAVTSGGGGLHHCTGFLECLGPKFHTCGVCASRSRTRAANLDRAAEKQWELFVPGWPLMDAFVNPLISWCPCLGVLLYAQAQPKLCCARG